MAGLDLIGDSLSFLTVDVTAALVTDHEERGSLSKNYLKKKNEKQKLGRSFQTGSWCWNTFTMKTKIRKENCFLFFYAGGRDRTGFRRFFMGFTGFYWVLLGFYGFYWVSPS